MDKQAWWRTVFVAIFVIFIAWSFDAHTQEVGSNYYQKENSLPTIMISDIPKNAPKYAQFPVKPFKGKLSMPHIGDNEQSNQYRTRIKASTKKGVNFAGYYNVATWSCGIACFEIVIINMKTGQIHYLPNVKSVSNYFIGGFTGAESDISNDYIDTTIGLGFRPESTLLIVGGPVNGKTNAEISYFVWQNNKLNLLRRITIVRGK